MSEPRSRPVARVEGLVQSAVNGETLVYDQDRKQIHHLNVPVAAIWNRCDGTQTLDELAFATNIAPAIVAEGLQQLAAANLLLTHLPSHQMPTRHTRRRLLRGAVAGGIALPAIVSLTAPAAATTISDLGCIQPIVDECPSENNGRCCRDGSGCVGICGDSICNPYPNGCF